MLSQTLDGSVRNRTCLRIDRVTEGSVASERTHRSSSADREGKPGPGLSNRDHLAARETDHAQAGATDRNRLADRPGRSRRRRNYGAPRVLRSNRGDRIFRCWPGGVGKLENQLVDKPYLLVLKVQRKRVEAAVFQLELGLKTPSLSTASNACRKIRPEGPPAILKR